MIIEGLFLIRTTMYYMNPDGSAASLWQVPYTLP